MAEERAQVHRSALADHPDIMGVLPRFVARLPGYVKRLQELQGRGEAVELARLVHQLRGAGKSFGFEPISMYAAELERLLQAGAPAEKVGATLNKLIGYLEHVEGYGRGA